MEACYAANILTGNSSVVRARSLTYFDSLFARLAVLPAEIHVGEPKRAFRLERSGDLRPR